MDPSPLSFFSLALLLELLGKRERDIVDDIQSTLESRYVWERDLAAVKNDGFALENLPHRKDDRLIALAAVNQDGLALRYASDRLKNDRDIVLAAVSQDGYALHYASEVLKNDREVVITAKSNR